MFLRSGSASVLGKGVTLVAAVGALVASVGCPSNRPVLTVDPEGWSVPATAGTADFEVTNTGAGYMTWQAAVISGESWLTIGDIVGSTLTVEFQNNVGAARTGQVVVSAAGASGSPKLLTITQAANSNIQTTIDAHWGGYWSYGGATGTVYIEWDFKSNGTFTWTIPNDPAPVPVATGTYVVGTSNGHQTVDITVNSCNSSMYEVGKTYRGWYELDNGLLHLTSVAETRPTWSSTILDPEESWVWVGTPIE